jgi:hypothetical protein
MTHHERKSVLEDLLRLNAPIDNLVIMLRNFPWDSEVECATLSAAHLVNVLGSFLSDRISAAAVEEWANAIEGREDIGFEADKEDLLREHLHELANPLLTQPLTKARAGVLLAKMASN